MHIDPRDSVGFRHRWSSVIELSRSTPISCLRDRRGLQGLVWGRCGAGPDVRPAFCVFGPGRDYAAADAVAISANMSRAAFAGSGA